jgi:hypothetical protein
MVSRSRFPDTVTDHLVMVYAEPMTRLKQFWDAGLSSSEAGRTANVHVHPWSVRPTIPPPAARENTMSPICGTCSGGIGRQFAPSAGQPMTAMFRMLSRSGWS